MMDVLSYLVEAKELHDPFTNMEEQDNATPTQSSELSESPALATPSSSLEDPAALKNSCCELEMGVSPTNPLDGPHPLSGSRSCYSRICSFPGVSREGQRAARAKSEQEEKPRVPKRGEHRMSVGTLRSLNNSLSMVSLSSSKRTGRNDVLNDKSQCFLSMVSLPSVKRTGHNDDVLNTNSQWTLSPTSVQSRSTQALSSHRSPTLARVEESEKTNSAVEVLVGEVLKEGIAMSLRMGGASHHTTHLTDAVVTTYDYFSTTEQFVTCLLERLLREIPQVSKETKAHRHPVAADITANEAKDESELRASIAKVHQLVVLRILNIMKKWMKRCSARALANNPSLKGTLVAYIQRIQKVISEIPGESMPALCTLEEQWSSYLEGRQTSPLLKPKKCACAHLNSPVFGTPDTTSNLLWDLGRHSSVTLAAEITEHVFAVFSAIPPEEWLHQRFSKPASSPGYQELCSVFNVLSEWTATAILREANVHNRAQTLSFFIDVARQLYKLNNFHCMAAVVFALLSMPIHRLRITFSLISPERATQLTELSALVSYESNYKTYRTVVNSAVAPCIPFLVPFMRDLIYLDEQATIREGHLHLPKLIGIHEKVQFLEHLQSTPYRLSTSDAAHRSVRALFLRATLLLNPTQQMEASLAIESKPSPMQIKCVASLVTDPAPYSALSAAVCTLSRLQEKLLSGDVGTATTALLEPSSYLQLSSQPSSPSPSPRRSPRCAVPVVSQSNEDLVATLLEQHTALLSAVHAIEELHEKTSILLGDLGVSSSRPNAQSSASLSKVVRSFSKIAERVESTILEDNVGDAKEHSQSSPFSLTKKGSRAAASPKMNDLRQSSRQHEPPLTCGMEYCRPKHLLLHCSKDVLHQALDETRVRTVLAPPPSLGLNAGYAEMINGGKTAYNEDHAVLLERVALRLPCGKELPYSFYAVFDGQSGPWVSIFLSQRLPSALEQGLQEIASLAFCDDGTIADVSLLRGMLQQLFVDLDKAVKDASLEGGASAILALFIASHLFVVNAGICRAVLFKSSGTGYIPISLSVDCTPKNERRRLQGVSEMVGCAPHFNSRIFIGGRPAKPGVRALHLTSHLQGPAFTTVDSADCTHDPLITDHTIMKSLTTARGVGFYGATNSRGDPLKPFISPAPFVHCYSLCTTSSLPGSRITFNEPEVHPLGVGPNDVLLIASHGLWSSDTEEAIADEIASVIAGRDPSSSVLAEMSRRLVENTTFKWTDDVTIFSVKASSAVYI